MTFGCRGSARGHSPPHGWGWVRRLRSVITMLPGVRQALSITRDPGLCGRWNTLERLSVFRCCHANT